MFGLFLQVINVVASPASEYHKLCVKVSLLNCRSHGIKENEFMLNVWKKGELENLSEYVPADVLTKDNH